MAAPAPRPADAAYPPDACDLSVVVVSYNVRAFLAQALRSVERASAGLAVEVFVVDNASRDGSADLVRARFPGVTLVASAENLGFGRANNVALRAARGRHVLLLNPDTIVGEDTLRTLVAYLDAHPDVGAVGPAILNPDGTFAPESRRAFPTPAVAFYRIAGLARLFPASPRFGRYNLTHLPRDAEAEVDALSGACMMLRRSALAAVAEGPAEAPAYFDEAFFMYGEDLDLCYRLQAAGWRIRYTPATQIVHYKGESTKKGSLRYVRLFYGAMEAFAAKHFRGAPGGALLLAGIRAAIGARAAAGVARRVFGRLGAPLRDAALAALALALAAGLHPSLDWTSARFLAATGGAFALGAVLGVALAGGYRPGHRGGWRRAPLAGAGAAFGAASTLAFFVPAVAFSRFAVLAGAVLAAPALALPRLLAGRRRGPRRAVFAGTSAEAAALAGHVGADAAGALGPGAWSLVGYVAPRPPEAEPDAPDAPVPYLGPPGALPDLVRAVRATDVLVGPSLPASAAFALLQALADAPVEVRMLDADGHHAIGKATVEPLR